MTVRSGPCGRRRKGGDHTAWLREPIRRRPCNRHRPFRGPRQGLRPHSGAGQREVLAITFLRFGRNTRPSISAVPPAPEVHVGPERTAAARLRARSRIAHQLKNRARQSKHVSDWASRPSLAKSHSQQITSIPSRTSFQSFGCASACRRQSSATSLRPTRCCNSGILAAIARWMIARSIQRRSSVPVLAIAMITATTDAPSARQHADLSVQDGAGVGSPISPMAAIFSRGDVRNPPSPK